MINKTYKIIHNKYPKLFQFLFFLRYLLGIFFISVVLFFLTPNFFDFKKKDKIIKSYLLENYDLTINSYESIRYNFLPIPNLELQNVDANIKKEFIKINQANLIIYPKLFNIYNSKIFESKKIAFYESKILLSKTNLTNLIKYISTLKEKITFKNSDLIIIEEKKLLIGIKKINFSNYGYNKDIIRGELFGKKFKIKTSENYNQINFELLKSGISTKINFTKQKKIHKKSGTFKSKLLNSNLKFNFNYDEKKLKIYNSYFRNKNLSFNNESIIIYKPFLSSSSIFEVNNVNVKWLKDININKILDQKNLIKKISSKNIISLKSKKFSRDLINDLNLNIDLAYGRLVYLKKLSISDGVISCQGDINLLEEYPILYFDCSIISIDKKKFLKIFLIKYKNKNEPLNLNVKGNINILNNKINFKSISTVQGYEALKEDLRYFKHSFENLLFDENLIGVFNIKKIKEFILEVY